jgi:hypothetical protein
VFERFPRRVFPIRSNRFQVRIIASCWSKLVASITQKNLVGYPAASVLRHIGGAGVRPKRVDDTLAIAALIQVIMQAFKLLRQNITFGFTSRLLDENRWRAARMGSMEN